MENTQIDHKYFSNQFSEEIWRTTYKLKSENTIEDTWHRVADAIASVECKPENKLKYQKAFYDLLADFKFVPGGRILANAGVDNKLNSTLLNCFVGVKPKEDLDSLEGILKVLRAQVKTLAAEGGWGMNFSFIRPRGTYIYGKGIRTPGAVKYMELFDKSSEVITEGPGEWSHDFADEQPNEKGKIRKGAQMMCLSCYHPDVLEFITAKQVSGKLTKANLSVVVSNEFMNRLISVLDLQRANPNDPKIEELNKWELIFPDTEFEKYSAEWDGNIVGWRDKGYPVKIYKTLKITDMWELIMKSTYEHNEPGVLFLDRANETNLASYVGAEQFIEATNPCGEIPLYSGGACLLGSFNLTKYVNIDKDSKTPYFNAELFDTDVVTATRFLDNVVDLTKLPLPEYNESILKYRKIGLGIMGLGSMFIMLGLRYGSTEAIKLTHFIMNHLNKVGLITSLELGKEKGGYSYSDAVKHINKAFDVFTNLTKKDKSDIQKVLDDSGKIRNCGMFTIAPTGNTGVLANCISGGLEPIFSLQTVRTANVPEVPAILKDKCPKFWEGDMSPNEYFKPIDIDQWNIHYLEYKAEDGVTYKIFKDRGLCKDVVLDDYGIAWLKAHKLMDANKDSIVCANELSADEHLAQMQACSEHIDAAISKTINLSSDYPYEDFKDIYLNAFKSKVIKGVTTYRDGTMAAVLSKKQEKNTDDKQTNDTLATAPRIIKTNAPKRPKTLPCRLHLVNLKGEPWYAIVSLLGEDPYEIFIGKNEIVIDGCAQPIFKQTLHNCMATFTKKQRGKYLFKSDDFEWLIERGDNEPDDTAVITALSRVMSCGLRHGCDISYLVQQLEKTKGSFTSTTKIFARVLKKYIKDGSNISGEICPVCGAPLIRKEGCKACSKCAWSACG